MDLKELATKILNKHGYTHSGEVVDYDEVHKMLVEVLHNDIEVVTKALNKVMFPPSDMAKFNEEIKKSYEEDIH